MVEYTHGVASEPAEKVAEAEGQHVVVEEVLQFEVEAGAGGELEHPLLERSLPGIDSWKVVGAEWLVGLRQEVGLVECCWEVKEVDLRLVPGAYEEVEYVTLIWCQTPWMGVESFFETKVQTKNGSFLK